MSNLPTNNANVSGFRRVVLSEITKKRLSTHRVS